MSAETIRFVMGGIGATLLITAAAFAIGAVLGIGIAAARRSSIRLLVILARVWVEVIRSAPPVVWLVPGLLRPSPGGISLEPLTAAIATFGLVASTYLSEIYRSGLSSVGAGQFEASTAVGLGAIDRMRFIIVPQVLRVIGPDDGHLRDRAAQGFGPCLHHRRARPGVPGRARGPANR